MMADGDGPALNLNQNPNQNPNQNLNQNPNQLPNPNPPPLISFYLMRPQLNCPHFKPKYAGKPD